MSYDEQSGRNLVALGPHEFGLHCGRCGAFKDLREEADTCCHTCGQHLHMQVIGLLDCDEADLTETLREIAEVALFADDIEGEPE